MPLTIISAEERISESRGAKILLLGPTGVGKTSQLSTLESSTTLLIDLEAGDLAVQDVLADTLRPKTWDECRDLAVYIGGPNPAMPPDAPYSQAHFDRVREAMGGASAFDRFGSFFIDSITVAGRLCFAWASQQPEAFSERTGKPDTRGAYGLHAREMIAWSTQLQHARAKNIILVGILEYVTDEFSRGKWQLQIE